MNKGEGARLDKAIACFQSALRVRTEQNLPADWARTQNNLGNAYRDLPTGDRAANLQQAIACFKNALTIWTPQSFPHYHQIAVRNLQNTENMLNNLTKE